MLKSIALISATLMGLAVMTPAQAGSRAERGQTRGVAQQARRYTVASERPVRRVVTDDTRRDRTAGRQGRTVIVRNTPVRRTQVQRAPVRRAPVRRVVRYSAPRYRVEKVWVPGVVRQVWVPPVYEYRRFGFFGLRMKVCVSPGHYRTIRDPGHWENRRVLVGAGRRR